MNNYYEKIVDTITGTETIRPFTAEEIADLEANRAAAELRAQAAAEAAAAKAALLEKLGITEEEAKLLLS